jgi:SAM-dependent methyltransferase
MSVSNQTAPQRVRRRFRAKARQFDDLYDDERRLVRLLRPGLLRRRQLAVDTVRAYDAPRVLDVGCGSGRIGELVLEAGAAAYVGVDFAEPMIELARERLRGFGDRAELITDDFLHASLSRSFEVVLALGLFDYLPNADTSAGEGTVAERFARRMFELCAPGGSLVGSFPAWSPVKGPIRKVRYEWIGDCPIFNYTRAGLDQMLAAAGFERVEIAAPGRSGFLVRADRP